MRFSIRFALILLALLAAFPPAAELWAKGEAEGDVPSHFVIIRSKYGCRGFDGAGGQYAQWCDAELSWDNNDPHPMASVEFNDRVVWELLPTGRSNHYHIRSKYGCPGYEGERGAFARWCDAELSWDSRDPHPMASVEFNDPVVWELVPTERADHFILLNKYGCPGFEGAGSRFAQWCDAELSWDVGPVHPMASVRFNDTVIWELAPAR